ncbi:hypothetical protein GH714_042001 [Hevea brasiliensis]|uniref:NADP-dependent oxidoreductase domain-containing protein n=1 Tax=Hevea brasiliensis TaxID=3981 RepID=A0A6A6MSX6_HEVBR|nr:hypothetical protein GH714_042001 [Hevea brasiliensis]
MGSIPVTVLVSSDKTIPLLGFGTAEYPFGTSSETMKDSFLHAIKLGYRHFDSAALYQSEHPLGEAISDAIQLGLVKSRDELFITSKLWCSDAHHDRVLPALHKTLKNLKLDYLDLYLIHFPVEMNPLWQQKKLRDFCEKKGIHITAYSPLGAKGTLWGTNLVLDCKVLKEIADAKGKTIGQVCLRWAFEQGVSVLVKSFNKERMKENLDIFEWKLSQDDLQKINQLPQRKGFPGLQFISNEGPYKSPEELWDEEIDLS